MNQEWIVHLEHVFSEANSCADGLTKRGRKQESNVVEYNKCPYFVYYVQFCSGLDKSKHFEMALCADFVCLNSSYK